MALQVTEILQEIDSVLEDHRDLGAKIAFGNLLPVDEDDLAAGERYMKQGNCSSACTYFRHPQEDFGVGQYQWSDPIYGNDVVDDSDAAFLPYLPNLNNAIWRKRNFPSRFADVKLADAIGQRNFEAAEYSASVIGEGYAVEGTYGSDQPILWKEVVATDNIQQ